MQVGLGRGGADRGGGETRLGQGSPSDPPIRPLYLQFGAPNPIGFKHLIHVSLHSKGDYPPS